MANTVDNPFAALLGDGNTTADGISKELIEKIFLFTLRNETSSPSAKLCLATVIVADDSAATTMSEELLSHALFERLLLRDTEEYLIPTTVTNKAATQAALEKEAITYLYRSYVACDEICKQDAKQTDDCEKIRNLILTNVTTCICQPDVFQGQNLAMQWLKIFEQSLDIVGCAQEFLCKSTQKVMADNEQIEALGALKATFYPLLTDVQKQIALSNIISLKKSIFGILDFFVRDKRVPELGEVLIDFCTPNPNAKGSEYMDTLLGQLLCISILPKYANGRYEFYSDIIHEANYVDSSLWQLLSTHQDFILAIVKQMLLLSATVKKKCMQWFANCLEANVARGHIWSSVNLNFEQMSGQNASDSFMIGLTAILLRLCAPLCEPAFKVLLVDPTYCAVPDDVRAEKQVNMLKAFEETCFLPVEEGEVRLQAEKYNFVTEIFFMTQKSFELSYRACYERFTRTARELHNLQTAYQDIVNRDPNNELAKNIMRMLREQMQQYLCMRNTLVEPTNDKAILKFFEASAIWLTEIVLISKEEFDNLLHKKEFAPQTQKQRSIPDEITFVPPYLNCVPENIVDNLVAYLTFNRNFTSGQFIEFHESSHSAFFKMVLLFMGRSELVKNPHLRAKLAEALEFMIPREVQNVRHSAFAHVFDTHPERLHVVKSLLNVFVSIEMTGQSVQFEQKFNYRRPMYAIIGFLWTKEEHVQCFRDLAKKAEENMDAIEPPIFLRFVNLLINDAIFLLDESLSNLEQIRQLQAAQENGEWDSMPHHERQQQVANLQHLGTMARFDNILGRDTINILKLLTTEIKSIFCHPTMVDRIAAMLNYFLLNLVGPKKERFKVNNKKEFEFDPAQTVLEICHIYINLSISDKFCLAVSQDGRSYSANLFMYADTILVRIGGGQLIGEMAEFAVKVQKLDAEYKKDQEFIADAPDEFLDPIMSTLMQDPVILPSSNVTVDRSTIARHLLSDQTDPFNRAPLTMDKVKSNEALKLQIDQWLRERRSGAN